MDCDRNFVCPSIKSVRCNIKINFFINHFYYLKNRNVYVVVNFVNSSVGKSQREKDGMASIISYASHHVCSTKEPPGEANMCLSIKQLLKEKGIEYACFLNSLRR